MMSSIRLSVSTSAVAITLNDPSWGTARAAPNIAFGLASAFASRPPDMVRPLPRPAALPEPERANEIDDTLDVGGAGARRARRLERQRTIGMDGAERSEFGTTIELRRRKPVDAHDLSVLQDEEIAASQPG